MVDKKSFLLIGNGGGGSGTQVQADWTEADSTQPDYIKNKPTIPTNTSDLTNDSGFITINDVPAQQQADWNEADSTDPSYIQNKPTIPTVNDATVTFTQGGVTKGSVTLNQSADATIALDAGGGTQVNADWNETDTTSPAYIENKPTLATVATSGSYTDLTNKPTIPAAQVNSDWNANSGVAEILNKPIIPANTSDLTNDSGFITISDVPAQQQADWNEADSTDPSYIQNKPTIPTVNDATVTFTQGGVTKGSVTLNQGTDATIALDAGGGTQVNADWNESDPTDPAYIENKPTIPAAQVNSDWNSDNGVSKILNKPRMGVETLTFTLSDQSTVSIDVWVRTPNYFYVEDISGNNNTLSIVKNNASAPTIEVFKSTDMKNWTSMGNTDTTAITATIPANGKLYLKATANQWGYQSGYIYYNTITASGNLNVGGNIMSLLMGDNYEGATLDTNYTFQFNHLFYNNTHLVDASDLELPSNVATQCYSSMFQGCTSLTTAPTLPATTLNKYCYQNMFRGCTALTTAPALPATTLAMNCYNQMFYGCTSLVNAPALPATTLADYCYASMFKNCTSLTQAPALPATTLAMNCYEELFSGCTALTTAPALPATDLTGANSCYLRLFLNCTSLVNVPTLPATTLSNLCYMSMFQGCTSLTTAPALPATTLTTQCYSDMFYGCTSLVTAPVLPATTPTQYCYYELFYGCTSLNRVECYANTMNSNYMNNWLYNTAATGDFYNLGGATTTYGIPSGWNIHTSL